MPVLNCSARTCVYNKDNLCSKGDIMVEGAGARTADQTCCSSFKERTVDGMKDSCGGPSEHIDVGCQACDCTYNEEKRCSAREIHISGSHACCCTETECGSFRSKER